MKHLLIIALLFTISTAWSQELVIIDKNKTTKLLFDQSNPRSCMSLLKLNAGTLGAYEIEGADLNFYNQLDDSLSSLFLRYEGPMQDVPLVDEFGNNKIETLPDGSQSFVYAPADSAFICFEDIDRLVFILKAGDGKPYDRINQLQLWKKFNGELQRVMTIDAQHLMTFEDVNIVAPLSMQDYDHVMGADLKPSLWKTMRDSTLIQLEWYQDRSENGVFRGYTGNSVHTVFPSSWTNYYMGSSRYLDSMYQAESDFFHAYFDYDNIYPFSRSFADSISYNLVDHNEILKHFNDVHSIKVQGDIPLIDPYGDNIVRENEYGEIEFVYEPPTTDYFFLDYEPTIFLSRQIIQDSAKQWVTTPTSLIFCLPNKEGKPRLVSTFQFDFDDTYVPRSYLRQYVDNFENEAIWQLPEFFELREIINDKKFLKKLSFKESTIPCEPCTNKKGRYALCWNGAPKMCYKYDTISEFPDGNFEAYRGKKGYLLDQKANVLFSGELDKAYYLHRHEGVYLLRNKNSWRVFDAAGEYETQWLPLENEQSTFNIDYETFIKLDEATFIHEKKGKKGLIDTRGNVLIPYKYNDLYIAPSFDHTYSMEYLQLTAAVGRIGESNEWQVFDADYKPSRTFRGEAFLDTHGKYMVFQEGRMARVYHAGTGKQERGFISEDDHLKLGIGNRKGVVDSTWKVIVPFEFSDIKRIEFDNNIFYFCSKNSGGSAIYDMGGIYISGYEEYNLTRGPVCGGLDGFYRIEKNNIEGVIKFNEETQSFDILFEPKFSYIACQSEDDPEKPMGRVAVQTEDGYEVFYIYQDGRMLEQ
ncbi:MAG: hypothetical protein P8P87_03050 [Crocinitomicaceae bacterium]|nr:hypothetical protein [Crocinitomicaceae bacterium]